MSIRSEIQRISDNIVAAKNAIACKGVTVPATATSDDLEYLISSIKHTTDYIWIAHLTWNGTTGTSDIDYDEIKLAVNGSSTPLGDYVLGSSVVGGYGAPRYLFAIAQITGQTSVYGSNMFTGGLVALDDTAKRASFLFSPSLMLWVDANKNVGAYNITAPVVSQDATTGALSIS